MRQSELVEQEDTLPFSETSLIGPVPELGVESRPNDQSNLSSGSLTWCQLQNVEESKLQLPIKL